MLLLLNNIDESNVSGAFEWQNWQCACAVSRDLVVRGHPKPHIICNQRPRFAYSFYNFYGATAMINGSLHGASPIVKRFSAENCPLKIRLKLAVFRE